MSTNLSNLFSLKTGVMLGLGSVLNIAGGGVRVRSFATPSEADGFAISQDWRAVGKDFQTALDEIKAEQSKQLVFNLE